MDISITLEGTSPLLMHNPRMVDPDFPINRELKAITSKRKKTDDDLRKMEVLEWHGGLYYDEETGIFQPSSKVRKSIIEAGRISKLGKHVERSLIATSLNVPLIYEGPENPDDLFQTGEFTSRLSVGVGNKRVMRVRPQFDKWALEVPFVLLEDAGLNYDELERLVDLAGRAIGIGDGRAIGYGRFTAKVETVALAKAA